MGDITAPNIEITKLESARRQIETAVQLFFNEDDIVSLHTLTAAAHQLLTDLSFKSGQTSNIKHEAKKYIKELKIVRLGCFANNKTACVMYKNSGFKEYGRLPAGIRHRGEFVDHVYFYKNI